MFSRRRVFSFAAGAGLAGLGAASTHRYFARDMAAARARSSPNLSRLAPTRFGPIGYAEAGRRGAPPVLMIHGTGGGFDQGLLFAAPLAASDFRVVSPSRFGYLRTAMIDDPSSERQADALVDLLDALGIDRVAVAGGSAGALPAIAFAFRHPTRCAALVPIVPATYAPNRPPARPWGPLETRLATSALASVFLFWSGVRGFPDRMISTLLATDPALVAAASPAERARVYAILQSILPVSARTQGLLNDARLSGSPAPMSLTSIRAPTLSISFEDDRFLTADAARHIAAEVAGARLIVYPTGGHVWVGRNLELFSALVDFLTSPKVGTGADATICVAAGTARQLNQNASYSAAQSDRSPSTMTISSISSMASIGP